MKLITKALLTELPTLKVVEDLYHEDEDIGKLKVYIHYFLLPHNWDWYVLGGTYVNGGHDLLFLVYATSPLCPEGELGYISDYHLENFGQFTLGSPLFKVQRDLYFNQRSLGDILGGQAHCALQD